MQHFLAQAVPLLPGDSDVVLPSGSEGESEPDSWDTCALCLLLLFASILPCFLKWGQ